MTLYKNPFENIVGKGENAGNQHFLLFPQCFLPFPKEFSNFLSHLFCCLQMLSIWTSLKFYRFVKSRVFHDPLVSLNFEGFDPRIFLNDSQNLLFTFCNSYGRGHCDPLNRKLRENPVKSSTHGNYLMKS